MNHDSIFNTYEGNNKEERSDGMKKVVTTYMLTGSYAYSLQ